MRWAVKGENRAREEKQRAGEFGDTKMKFTSLLLSGPCRHLTLMQPETCKLELTSHHRTPRKRSFLSPSKRKHFATTSKTSLKLPQVASHICKLVNIIQALQELRSYTNQEEKYKVLSTHLGNTTEQAIT